MDREDENKNIPSKNRNGEEKTTHTQTHINRITVAQRAIRATMGHVFIKQNKEQQQKFEKKK